MQKCLALAAECHKALRNTRLAEDLAIDSRLEPGCIRGKDDWEESRSTAEVYDDSRRRFAHARSLAKRGASLEEVTAELEIAAAGFKKLAEFAIASRDYPAQRALCLQAIAHYRLLYSSADAKPGMAGKLRSKRRQPIVTTIRNAANSGRAEFEVEQCLGESVDPAAIADGRQLRHWAQQAIMLFVFLFGPCLLFVFLGKQSEYVALAAMLLGPIVVAFLASCSWLWKSGHAEFRFLAISVPLLTSLGLALSVPALGGELQIVGGIFLVLSTCASLLFLLQFDALRKRFKSVEQSNAHLSRVMRHADDLSGAWAQWLWDNWPRVIVQFLVRRDVAGELCLRAWLHWAPRCFVCTTACISLWCSLLRACEVIELPARPPHPARCRPHRNISSVWAILLRCPLHVARGDDIALAH